MSNFSKQNFNSSNNQGSNGQEIGNSVAFNADGTVMAVGFSETTLSGNNARGTVRIYNFISKISKFNNIPSRTYVPKSINDFSAKDIVKALLRKLKIIK